jgi:hypothetical protein
VCPWDVTLVTLGAGTMISSSGTVQRLTFLLDTPSSDWWRCWFSLPSMTFIFMSVKRFIEEEMGLIYNQLITHFAHLVFLIAYFQIIKIELYLLINFKIFLEIFFPKNVLYSIHNL